MIYIKYVYVFCKVYNNIGIRICFFWYSNLYWLGFSKWYVYIYVRIYIFVEIEVDINVDFNSGIFFKDIKFFFSVLRIF